MLMSTVLVPKLGYYVDGFEACYHPSISITG